MKQYQYDVKVEWTGNKGKGTLNYKEYGRNFLVSGIEKNTFIPGSADPDFLGDPKRYNPEDMLVSSLASCHMLWFLHLCAINKVVVVEYIDCASGTMEISKDGKGQFTAVTLKPLVVVAEDAMLERIDELHTRANNMCFIANSCKFPIKHEGTTAVQNDNKPISNGLPYW